MESPAGKPGTTAKRQSTRWGDVRVDLGAVDVGEMEGRSR